MQWSTAKHATRVIVLIACVAAGIVSVVRWLTSNLYGVLALFSLAYMLLPRLGIVPLKPQELAIWFSELAPDVQAGAISSAITVIGYLAAFWSSYYLWQKQTAAQIQTGMMEELDTFFRRALNNARTVNRSQLLFIEVAESLKESRLTASDLSVNCTLYNRYREDFEAAKLGLQKALSDIHELRSRLTTPLAATKMGLWGFENSAKFLDELSAFAYEPFPTWQLSEQGFLQAVREVDITMLKKFDHWVEVRGALMLGGIGGVRGSVYHIIFRTPASTVYSVWRSHKKWFADDGPLREPFERWQEQRNERKD